MSKHQTWSKQANRVLILNNTATRSKIQANEDPTTPGSAATNPHTAGQQKAITDSTWLSFFFILPTFVVIFTLSDMTRGKLELRDTIIYVTVLESQFLWSFDELESYICFYTQQHSLRSHLNSLSAFVTLQRKCTISQWQYPGCQAGSSNVSCFLDSNRRPTYMTLGGLSLRTSRLHLASFKYSCEKLRFFMVSGYIMQLLLMRSIPLHVS